MLLRAANGSAILEKDLGQLKDVTRLSGADEPNQSGCQLFDPADPRIKEDILRMIIQYLQGEGYMASVLILQDEANVKGKERLNKMVRAALLRREGLWYNGVCADVVCGGGAGHVQAASQGDPGRRLGRSRKASAWSPAHAIVPLFLTPCCCSTSNCCAHCRTLSHTHSRAQTFLGYRIRASVKQRIATATHPACMQCTRATFRGYKGLLYAIYRQQYLELIDRQESQKAFSLLSRRLKPLEGMQRSEDEFRDLCYLLTCKSISDVPSCRDWEGVLVRSYFLVFVPTIREIRDFYREM
eukprot:SAG31_NODE_6409_length_2030_cov_1.370274_2_plen_298_part_00